MLRQLSRKFKRLFQGETPLGHKYNDINPEDIFLDSTNLPGFEENALEGRIERPMSQQTFAFLKIVLGILVLLLVSKLWFLGVKDGAVYAEISDNNRLEETLLFANRGIIVDRNGVELATNNIKEEGTDFARRHYADISGISHVVGYVKYPLLDQKGFYAEVDYRAHDGVESAYDEVLKGTNGLKLTETDVSGNVTSESIVDAPKDGEMLMLSIDAKITQEFYKAIEHLATDRGFSGGAGVIMDVETGEILALTSYPEYNSNALTTGLNQEEFNKLLNDSRKPFLNRVTSGLYTPGSIIKPIIALAALSEGIISPEKEILSTGFISIPNPYDPSKPSIFRDWKEHGWTAMREALAVSSDTYFYSIGGGYGDQKGLGITLIDKYLKMFGLEETTGIELGDEQNGIVATPEWKAKNFNGDIWRLGDTYITSIGQFGTQVTPLNVVRFIAAVANKGKLLKPSLVVGGNPDSVVRTVTLNEKDWQVVHEGMRQGVTYGSSVGLNVPYVEAAGKTGTAEVGANKQYVNSWSVGFFPYEQPKYAWAVVMERGPANNTTGATSIMRQLFDWMSINTPEYFE
jgi:penicillin-binding protein 2